MRTPEGEGQVLCAGFLHVRRWTPPRVCVNGMAGAKGLELCLGVAVCAIAIVVRLAVSLHPYSGEFEQRLKVKQVMRGTCVNNSHLITQCVQCSRMCVRACVHVRE